MNLAYHGTESFSFLDPTIGNLLPERLKKNDNLRAFITAVKSWKPEKCPLDFAVYILTMSVLSKKS